MTEVRMRVPSLAAWLVDLEDRQEGLLRDLDGPHLLHALLALLLLLEELALPADVAAVALREHVLPQRLHRLAGDDLLADGRLDRDLEQLPRDQVLQLVRDLPAPLVRLVAVNDDAEGVDRVAVDQHVELHEIALAIAEHVVVEARVAAAHR